MTTADPSTPPAAEPATDGMAVAGAVTTEGDRYRAAVDELAAAAVQLYSLIYDARHAIGRHRATALTGLHQQLQAMADTVTTAIGAARDAASPTTHQHPSDTGTVHDRAGGYRP